MIIKATPLRRGDTIGIVSPSWGGAAAFPHRVERGRRQLEQLGFQVKLAPHAGNSIGFVSDTAENRAADIHAMFGDPAVKAIISTIGGDHACHLLPLLDFDFIAAHPKVFMGFSDMTVLNVAIHALTGLVTFNGPHLMTDFAEYPQMPGYSQQSFLKATTDPAPIGMIEPAAWWTDEFLDWGQQEDLTRARVRHDSDGWRWLKPGRGEGPLVGGCIESLQHLRGTRYWPDLQGAILFLETSEEKPGPETVDALLMDFENMSAFGQIAGLLVARPMKYTAEEREQLRLVIRERTARFDFPVLADVDCGHTTPMLTLPIGCRAVLDSEEPRFEVVEGAVGSGEWSVISERRA